MGTLVQQDGHPPHVEDYEGFIFDVGDEVTFPPEVWNEANVPLGISDKASIHPDVSDEDAPQVGLWWGPQVFGETLLSAHLNREGG